MAYIKLCLASIMLVCVHGGRTSNSHCDNPVNIAILAKYLVKEDPTHFFDETFSDVWVRKTHEGVDKCTYIKYSQEKDGSILESAVFKTVAGADEEGNPEYMKKTDRIGVYDVNGKYVATNEEYTGKMYILDADENVISYFVCELNAEGWNAAVQVKSSVKDKLLSTAGENDVKKSIDAAKAKLDQMAKEYVLQDYAMMQYNLEDLCP